MKMTTYFVLGYSLFFSSCSLYKSTGPTETSNSAIFSAVFTQIAGCKEDVSDSTFAYEFIGDLKVWFVVRGNCCPDSNRFVVSSQSKNDTIFVFPVDMAARFCRCICPYLLYAEFKDLPLDRYVFVCKDENVVLYNELVSRKK